MVLAAELGHENIDAMACHFFRAIAENRGHRGIDGDDRSPLVDGDDAVGHPVQHGGEPSLALAKRRGTALGFGAFKSRGEGLPVHAMQRLGQENHGRARGGERKRPGQICRALNGSGPNANRQYRQCGGEHASRQAPKKRGQEHSRKEYKKCPAAFHSAEKWRAQSRGCADGGSAGQKLIGDVTFRPKQPVQPKLRYERHGETHHLPARARR